MEKNKRKLPILRDLDALYEGVGKNREQIQDIEKEFRAATDEISIHGQVIAEQRDEIAIHGEAIGSQQNEIAVHGEFIGSLQNEVAVHGEVIGNLQNEIATHGAAIGANKKQVEMLVSEICSLKARVNELERRLADRGAEEPAEKEQSRTPSQMEQHSDSYYSIDYFDFENRFRGSRETIMDRQKIYLPYFQGCQSVVDIGCGRGEFLELLLSNGIGATGVDLYEPYVEYVKMQGLPCVCADVNEYLRDSEGIDGIFLGQVVEHLSTSQIIELVKNSYDALVDGRYLIMETPNPMTLSVFSHAFYMDPSHEKPVHPYTLKYITEKAGFSSVEILFTECSRIPFEIPELKLQEENITEFNQAMKQLSTDLYGSQDYAIIARK